MVVMRNSARPDSGYLYFSFEEFDTFISAAKAGQVDQAR
jgi:hypothetical protein